MSKTKSRRSRSERMPILHVTITQATLDRLDEYAKREHDGNRSAATEHLISWGLTTYEHLDEEEKRQKT